MNLTLLLIYYVIIIAIVAIGVGVVLSRSPINAIFYLILLFILASILFFCFGAEFFAIMFATIYIGAIAVLFLFVIMMLNVKIVELRVSYYIYLPVTVLIIFFLLLEFKYILYSGDGNSIFLLNLDYVNWFVFINDKSVVDRIGFVLYNEFIFYFFFCSLLLFLATFASISLTKLTVDGDEERDKFYYYRVVKFDNNSLIAGPLLVIFNTFYIENVFYFFIGAVIFFFIMLFAFRGVVNNRRLAEAVIKRLFDNAVFINILFVISLFFLCVFYFCLVFFFAVAYSEFDFLLYFIDSWYTFIHIPLLIMDFLVIICFFFFNFAKDKDVIKSYVARHPQVFLVFVLLFSFTIITFFIWSGYFISIDCVLEYLRALGVLDVVLTENEDGTFITNDKSKTIAFMAYWLYVSDLQSNVYYSFDLLVMSIVLNYLISVFWLYVYVVLIKDYRYGNHIFFLCAVVPFVCLCLII